MLKFFGLLPLPVLLIWLVGSSAIVVPLWFSYSFEVAVPALVVCFIILAAIIWLSGE